jgi:SAM-dependent methyltransferase
MARTLQETYNAKYRDEEWKPLALQPDRVSATRYDDVARLLRGARGVLCEVGCGSGQLTLALAAQFERATGLDLASVRIARAQQVLAERYPQYADKVKFVVGSADEPFPFPTAAFDVVIACAVIEHCVDVFFVMDEIARVCRPGGCVVLTVPNVCYVKHVLSLLRGQVPLTGSPNRDIRYWRENGWDGGHLHYFSRHALHNLLTHCGFVPEVWTGDGKYAKLRRWATCLVGNLTVRARRR